VTAKREWRSDDRRDALWNAVRVVGQGAVTDVAVSATSFRIAILGPIEVSGREQLQLRDRIVLGVLVVRTGAAVTVDQIGFVIWGDELPASYRKVIQGSVVRLRRDLGRDAIRTVADGYRLDVTDDHVDVREFERRIARATDHLAVGQADLAARELRHVLTLWRGAPLAELDGWEPAEAEARRLVAVRENAEDLLLESLLHGGHHAVVAADAGCLIERTPYREARWAIWARALYAQGRQVEALQVVTRLRTMLRDELGVDPTPQVETLELAILQHDPKLRISPAVSSRSTCPWPGLLPYERDDAAGFFARDADAVACIERLTTTGRLVIVGRSGCGKSSLARAGVVPRLDQQGRPAVVVTPGAHPLAELPELADDVVLVVDQAEEAITQCADDEARRQFFDRVAQHPGGVVVVARADLLVDLAAYPGFADSTKRDCGWQWRDLRPTRACVSNQDSSNSC
jgi:DNA-binding SARP family transcriptional activator